MICLHCTQLNLRDYPKHATHGMGSRNANPVKGEFVTLTYRRDCKQYKRADEAVILKRQAWHDQLNMFRK